MKQYIKSIVGVFIVGIIIAITQLGCKEHTIISSGFAPGINNVDIFTKSFSVLTKTKYYDSVITSNALSYIYMGIGVAQDPQVGKTNAGLYFQVIPGVKNTGYSNYTIDSAFIILPYSGFTYGDNTDKLATKSFSVYGITDPSFSLNNSSGTPTDYFGSYPTAAGNYYFTSAPINIYNLNTLDSFNVGGVNYHPHMRLKINLNDPRAMKLIHDLEHTDSITADYPSYVTAFPGIYIQELDTTTSNHSTTIPYFQLDNEGTTNYDGANVLLYVHADTVASQLTFYFSSQYCAHYNRVTHQYNSSATNTYFKSTAASDANVLLENGPGAVIDVKIGGIQSLVQPDPITHIVKTPIVNQAQLKFTVSQPSAAYLPPFSTYPYSVNTVAGFDVLSEVADRYPVTSIYPLGFIDGSRDSVMINNVIHYSYTLNVPRELQLALSNKLDTLHLRINGGTNYWGAFRAIIGGGNNPDTTLKMKFNVVYSKLK
ncbi:MAG: DUF4270 family protein [Flavipsychrobacter sp.]|nr:DUF4270 family protein [Flavipsychrobacter sp.]